MNELWQHDPTMQDTEGGQLCADLPCPRCSLTEWKTFEDQCEIRCGGCGFLMIDDMIKFLAVDEKHRTGNREGGR